MKLNRWTFSVSHCVCVCVHAFTNRWSHKKQQREICVLSTREDQEVSVVSLSLAFPLYLSLSPVSTG